MSRVGSGPQSRALGRVCSWGRVQVQWGPCLRRGLCTASLATLLAVRVSWSLALFRSGGLRMPPPCARLSHELRQQADGRSVSLQAGHAQPQPQGVSAPGPYRAQCTGVSVCCGTADGWGLRAGWQKCATEHGSGEGDTVVPIASCRLNGKEHSVFTGVAIVHCCTTGTAPPQALRHCGPSGGPCRPVPSLLPAEVGAARRPRST